jgi:hypothetical protein
METIFKFTPKDAFSSKIMAEDLTDQKDFQTFMKMNIDKSITATFSLTEKLSEKQQMYDFYHKVILGVAIQAYTNDGWEAVDKVFADHLLKAECAREIKFNSKTNKEEIYLLDKSRMNRDRLHKFITDCITLLEVEKGYRVPDSSEYLMELATGISGFKSVNSRKK